MFPNDLSFAVLSAVVLSLTLLVGLWLFYDRRDHLLYDRTRRRTTFHCLKCSHVYTSADQADTCSCPRCGHANPRLRF